jgi:hypothetical protein
MNLFFDLSFIGIFALLAVFVKRVRITSCIILMATFINLWMMDSYNMLAAQGETIGLLIMGSFDMMAAMSLLIFHADPDAEKAPEQAIIFTLFAICHGCLAFDMFAQGYVFYDVYDYLIWGLTLAHVTVMGGYYEELIGNFKETLGGWFNAGHSSGNGRWSLFRKLRGNSVVNPDRHSLDGDSSGN